MMIAGACDTHAALWYLFDDKRLSSRAASFIEDAARNRRNVIVSAISLAEVAYLTEKKRVPPIAYQMLKQALANPEHLFMEAEVTVGVVDAMRRVPRDQVPDMPDRIIAGTAIYFDIPLLSRDGRIRSSEVETIW